MKPYSLAQSDEARMPWRDITTEWNAALDSFIERTGRYWHGRLGGTKSKEFPKGWDRKRCCMLVVVDSYQGAPIDLTNWSGYPDYWDFRRIIAQPVDAVFRGVRGQDCVPVEDNLREHVARLIAMHNASLSKVLA